MSATLRKRIGKVVGVSTTGVLLIGFESAKAYRLTAGSEVDGTLVLYVEHGATFDGGSLVAARAESYTVAQLPVDVDTVAGGAVKLFGSDVFDVTVTPR